MPLILVFYFFTSWIIGGLILQRIAKAIPVALFYIGSFLIGTLVSVPVTYLLSCLFVITESPMLWGTILVIVIELSIIGFMLRGKNNSSSPSIHLISDIVLIFFAFVFSLWMMLKTFHGDAIGQLFVGSNNIFDFSHALGIIRSFSFGSNIPFVSPFQAGLPYFYHFFFNFYVSLWEYFGVPIIWAMNMPSAFAFTSLLVVIYFLPQLLFKQSVLIGWIAVVLTLTNSTLTWWQILIQKGLSIQMIRSLWALPTYPFAGPFDGATISIFMTLNNYINQRHLAFAIACSILFLLLIVKQIEQNKFTVKTSLIYGVFFGLLGLWNITITLIGVISTVLLLIPTKFRKQSVVFALAVGNILLLWYGQYLFMYKELFVLGKAISGPTMPIQAVWNASQYFLLNLGILPIVVLLGYFVISKKSRVFTLPFLLLSVSLCIVSVVEKVGFDQKFLSFLIIWANVFAAIGVGWLWNKQTLIPKLGALCLFIVLTISGVIDLFPIKNEFAYPMVDSSVIPVVSWIRTKTSSNAVFVSYSDMIDPVAFAGRKNYFGFFGNIGSYDRSEDVKNIYAGNNERAKKMGVSYILVPKWNKNDFPYHVNTDYFKKTARVAYEDDRFLIFDIRSSMVQ